MLRAMAIVGLLAVCGHAQEKKAQAPEGTRQHEAAEDKARTVPGGASKGVKACHADIERWCKDVKAGEGRLGACLTPHAKELSKRCRRWASHGGKTQVPEALARDLDGSAAPSPK